MAVTRSPVGLARTAAGLENRRIVLNIEAYRRHNPARQKDQAFVLPRETRERERRKKGGIREEEGRKKRKARWKKKGGGRRCCRAGETRVR